MKKQRFDLFVQRGKMKVFDYAGNLERGFPYSNHLPNRVFESHGSDCGFVKNNAATIRPEFPEKRRPSARGISSSSIIS
jgi:hypothetical protein